MISIVDIKDVLTNRKKWKKCGEYIMRIENGYTILKCKKSFKFLKQNKVIDQEILEIPKL